jgi:hypothetical protein
VKLKYVPFIIALICLTLALFLPLMSGVQIFAVVIGWSWMLFGMVFSSKSKTDA